MPAANPGDRDRIQPLRPRNLAYVIYTSGSTGTPKGVAITHAGLKNFALSQANAFCASPQSRILQFSSISFDASIFEIGIALVSGSQLVIAPRGCLGEELSALIVKNEVEIAILTPAILRTIEDQINLATLAVGGDRWSYNDVGDHIAATQLVNAYGPTEATVCATVSDQVVDERVIPIGRPIWNTRVYVLDQALEPVGIGVSGELYIGGVGLARGYLGRSGLTAERFIANPFGESGARMYRTGDLARWRTDGQLEFLGRIDHQVKIRGVRIEPGEIEAALCAHPSIASAAVIAREDEPGDRRLVAYVVASAHDAVPGGAELRTFLSRTLPDHMLPAAFVQLARLPLTPSGKVDRRALPAPEGRSGDAHVAPRTPVEEVLASIWAEVLRLDRVGVKDNFFELGGHSLLAMRVVARVRDAFKIELPLRVLFDGATIAALAVHVDAERRAGLGLQVPSLVAQSRPVRLPLSFAQERLWFLDQLQPGGSEYNIPWSVRLEGALNVAALEGSIGELVARHESLRTRIVTVDGQGAQVIEGAGPFRLPIVDLSPRPAEEQEAESLRVMRAEALEPFDLERGPLLRTCLLRLAAEEHVLLVTMHHIISDGWSMGVLIRELGLLYLAFSQGRPSPLPALPVQCADYALWQRGWLQGEVLERQLAYWKERLAGSPAALELPTDHGRPVVPSFRGKQLAFALSAELSAALVDMGRRRGATLYMVLLAAFQLLLSRWSGEDDIVVGSPIAGRTQRQTEGLIGFFVNTLVLRTELSGEPSFVELLERVKEAALGAYAHEDVPFEKLVAELQPQRDLSRQPLFQVMFALQNLPQEKLNLPDLRLSLVERGQGSAKFDLFLQLTEGPGGLTGILEYATDLFEQAMVERLVGHFRTLLEEIVADPERRVSEFDLLSKAERHQLAVEWNDTAGDYPRDKCMHELFAEQAARTPDAVAVVFENQQLSYGELDRRSNQLAHHLRSLGVGPEVVTGLCVERTLDLVIGLLGILKAGGAYLPLDPGYPQERLAYMLADARAPVLVTQARLQDVLPRHEARIVRMDADWAEIAQQPGTAPSSGLMPDNLAYVIYTSGSTGKPKGVGGRHASVTNRVTAQQRIAAYSDTDVCCQKGSVGFVDSLFEILAPMSWGKKLVVVSSEASTDAQELISELKRHQVTRLVSVPSLALTMITLPEAPGRLAGINCWVLSGEACGAELLRRLSEALPNCRFVNLYGSTEVAADATAYAAEGEEELIPIGRPILNTQAYILGEHFEAVPIGVSGELYIGGVGLARGYLGRPGLTAERFVPNPFGNGDRLYRTGDLARWRADGQLEFVGRIDHQVKVRGYRIELGEIETVLLGHDQVEQVVVAARDDEVGGKRLVAYVVGAGGVAPEIGELRAHLRQQLPNYMVPTAFVVLEALPLTPNGKLDRRALPVPALVRDESTALRTPQGPVEEALARLMADLLGLDRVGADDNFFDLGGHSLLAVRLIARVRQSIGTELSLRSLFEGPTPRGLAALIAASSNQSHIPINHSSAEQVATIYLRSGSQQPIFCVHPAGGVPTVYRFIASELQADVPVVGLQARGLDSDIEPHLTIHDMAEAYVRTICEYQRSGPLRILGWSFGGLVALEMAAIFEQMGRAPEQVFLMDSNLETSADVQQMTMSDCLRLFCNIFGFDFQEPSSGETKRLLFEEMKTIKMFSDSNGIQFFERFLANFIHSVNLSQRWTPRKINAPIAYLRSNDNPSSDLEANLRQVTSGRFEIIDVDAPHYSMCSMTNSKKAAVHLDRLLARHSVERP